MPQPSSSPNDTYSSPLADRYASREMLEIWSPRRKFQTWRKIWLAVAEAQHEMGLPVSKEQVEELRANLEVTDEDIALAREYEGKLRHDVMSHVHAWGDKCPTARGIIHLGMTSQDINCNTELLQIDAAVDHIHKKLKRLCVALCSLADQYKSLPTLGFTHYQPAQPTTVGRRAAQWAHDLYGTYHSFERDVEQPLRGFRGATGTQASFLQLLDGNPLRVREFEGRALINLKHLHWGRKNFDQSVEACKEIIAWKIERGKPIHDSAEPIQSIEDEFQLNPDHVAKWLIINFNLNSTYPLSGQTYSRNVDCRVVSACGNAASLLHKIATDIRLLSNRKELDEPFAKNQIGSSAMPYKRNPMRCERVCAIARYVWNLVPNTYDTAATQWLERTLDDSANRRMVLPEAFLGLDACLNIMHNVISGLIVNEAMVRKNLMDELPFLATESMMMEAVKLGRDRQDVHEAIRLHSIEAGKRIKQEGKDNDLVERLRTEPLLEGVDIDAHLNPMRHVGLAVEQTERFLHEVIDPIREELGDGDTGAGDLSV